MILNDFTWLYGQKIFIYLIELGYYTRNLINYFIILQWFYYTCENLLHNYIFKNSQ